MKKCCPKCNGAYKDSDLDNDICRDNGCVCHKPRDFDFDAFRKASAEVRKLYEEKRAKTATIGDIEDAIEQLKNEIRNI